MTISARRGICPQCGHNHDLFLVPARYTPDVQTAIDAALADLIGDIGSLYLHGEGRETYNRAIDDCAAMIKDRIGTNPLAILQKKHDDLLIAYGKTVTRHVDEIANLQAKLDKAEDKLGLLMSAKPLLHDILGKNND